MKYKIRVSNELHENKPLTNHAAVAVCCRLNSQTHNIMDGIWWNLWQDEIQNNNKKKHKNKSMLVVGTSEKNQMYSVYVNCEEFIKDVVFKFHTCELCWHSMCLKHKILLLRSLIHTDFYAGLFIRCVHNISASLTLNLTTIKSVPQRDLNKPAFSANKQIFFSSHKIISFKFLFYLLLNINSKCGKRFAIRISCIKYYLI